MSDPIFGLLERAHLAPSPTNPRKHFDQIKLQELAESIRSKGIIEPLVVRPMTDATLNGTTHEIIVGERRFHAAGIAELELIPCIIRELGDLEVLELQTIENLQRDDLHELEEADGYAQLQKVGNYDVAEIAAKIGRSPKYVYDRLKLRALIPALKELFFEEAFTASHAILLSRLTPKDQKRALEGEERFGQITGLFQRELADPTQLDLDGDGKDDPRKAVSVRELEHWITDHVRFRPEDVDLVELFPETLVKLASAREEELKVVHITREYRVSDDAKDEKGGRTYGRDAWRRADGEIEPDLYSSKVKISKPCERSVMGIIVAGHGRGEAFRVCIDRKRCEVHWKAEIKAAPKPGSRAKQTQASKDNHSKWEREQANDRLERERWSKAKPKLLEALAAALSTADPLELMKDILKIVSRGWGPRPKQMAPGDTLESQVRYAAFLLHGDRIDGGWWKGSTAPKELKRFGVDARKIVDQVAPKPKATKPLLKFTVEKKPKAKAPAKKKAKRKKKAAAAAGGA